MPRLVEVEDANGRSFNFGEWIERWSSSMPRRRVSRSD
jgi:hypothetical protein